MNQYDWEAVFNRASGLAHQCTTETELAEALGIPRTTLHDAMRRHGVSIATLLREAEGTQTATIQKLQLQNKALRKEIDYLEKRLGKNQWLHDTMLEVASMLSPGSVEIPPHNPKAMRSQTAVLQLSDIHMGQKTPAEQMLHFGEYNSNIAERRTSATFTKFASVALHQPFAIEEVVVVGLGDWVEHAHLRRGHEGYVDMNVVKQTLRVANVGIAGLSMLAAKFPKVRFVGVVGNHGRVAKKPGQGDPSDSFDYMTYRIIQMALANQENIEWDIPESWYTTFKVYDWNVFAFHGDDIRSYVGFPWYGATRAARKYVSMFRLAQRRLIRDNQPQSIEELKEYLIVPDVALLAHFHTAAEWEAPDIECFANGSLPGVSYYGAKRVMTISRPSQRMFFMHPKYGVGMRCPLDLDEVN